MTSESLSVELPAEVELLVRCARTKHDQASLRHLRELVVQGIDWEAFFEVASAHEVLPLVGSSLAHVSDVIPGNVRAHLDEYSRLHNVRSLRLVGVLADALEAMRNAGIVAFPYKGPALAAVAYGNVLLRTFVDLDVLVPKIDYLRAIRALEGIGFEPAVEYPDDRFYLRWKSAHSFVRDGVHVDLQWASTAIEGLSVPIGDEFWRAQDTVQVAGMSFPAIGTEDLLLFLCGHGSRHHWDRLKWVCDVAELTIASQDLDWKRLFRRADQMGAGRVLRLGLLLAESILDVELPETVAQASRADPVSVRLAKESAERLLLRQRLSDLAEIHFDLSIKNRWRDRLRYLGFRFMQPSGEDWAELRAGRLTRAFYPVILPLRRAWRLIAKRLNLRSRAPIDDQT